MIINPSHEITLSGLPSDVLDAYVRYKKGSRAIVTWLVQFGPVSFKGARTLPIKELAALARKVSSKITSLPDVIDFHFRETIAARRCLSKYFRENRDESEDDYDTINHEHFTNSLNDIYIELCEKCRGSNTKTHARQPYQSGRDITTAIRNHYDCLPVEHISLTEETLNISDTSCRDCREDPGPACSDATGLSLEDDMAVAIENIYLLDQAQGIFDAVEACWTKAGLDEISFVAAAGTTTTAWQLLLDIEAQLKIANPCITLEGLHSQLCLLPKQASGHDLQHRQSKYHKLLLALQDSERAIKHYTQGHRLKAIETCASCIQKPGDYVQSLDTTHESNRTSFQIALLDNVFHFINRACTYPGIALNSSPCLNEVGYLLSHIDDHTCIFRCTLNMHLLATSYHAFITACTKPSMVSMCRVRALRLAQQATVTIDTALSDKHAFPCQCPQTLAYHLSTLQHDLNAFAKHRCWDLYFQSPWAAGSHMTEMLDMLAYYGMQLFHYRHYVGSVLHTYNAMRQLGGLASLEPLEQICDLFEDLFFPAQGRPAMSFKNSWSRFVGARLKFKRDHKGSNHRESWCMAIPAHAARAAAGLGSSTNPTGRKAVDPKFDYGQYDPLIKLKQSNYKQTCHVDEFNAITQLSFSPPGSKSVPSSAASSPRSSSISVQSGPTVSSSRTSSFSQDSECFASSQHPLHDTARQLDQAIRTSSDGTETLRITTTRLNLVAVFSTCTEIVRKISDRIHTRPEEKAEKNCICFTTTLLTGADRIVEGRKLGRLECWRKNEREVIEIVNQVITEVITDIDADGGKKWLWDL